MLSHRNIRVLNILFSMKHEFKNDDDDYLEIGEGRREDHGDHDTQESDGQHEADYDAVVSETGGGVVTTGVIRSDWRISGNC